MDDDFRTAVITRLELNRIFQENKTLKTVFKEIRKLSSDRGLSYSTRLGIMSWWDDKGALRQKNYMPQPKEVVNEP